jgi:uncharacterized membrane protein
MRIGLRHRPVMVVAGVAGLALALLHEVLGVGPVAAGLLGWCLATLVYCVPVYVLMRNASPEMLRVQAERMDESEAAVLGASIVAALASLAGVGWFLAMRGPLEPWEAVLPLVTIVLSWSFIHLAFAVRYAHEYWQWDGGIAFPGEERPLFSDFLYLAFTIGMTFQTSDVAFTSRMLRRVALTHALVSFLFNVVIIAAAVNLAAGLVH